jgi:predicted GTPase
MSETNGIMQRARETRLETVSILKGLTEKAGAFELPQPPEALDRYRDKLEENTYKVLVAGETKRGKSTFVNALIGQDVLPTAVQVSTSQVFCVRQTESESYRLRFEDNSAREIPLKDLSRYGSQVQEDLGEKPELNEIIRWIEVDRPNIRFLPEGVSLLDTPGLGALYAAHAQITHRFVPQADAVIFVLDSEKQIVQSEVEFIKSILDVTSDIFFIQTKIDLFDEGVWREVQSRNQEILEEKFGERLTNTCVWPISSELLQKAASANEKSREFLVAKSLYEELEAALQTFLFHVAGWNRSAEALVVADRYHAASRQTLDGRLTALVEDAKKRGEMQKQASDRNQQFNADWGQKGKKRNELIQGVKQATSRGKKSILQALQPTGRIAQLRREKIEAAESTKDIEQLNEALPVEIKAAVQNEWRRVCQEVHRTCGDLLGPFMAEAEALNAGHDPKDPDLKVRGRNTEVIESQLWEKVKGSSRDLLMGALLANVVLSVAAPVVLVVAVVGGLIWAARYGWKSAGRQQVEKAKQQMNRNVDHMLQQVRAQLLEGDVGRDGLVDQYFNQVQAVMLDEVKKITRQKEMEAKAEFDRLVEAGNLNDKQRKEKVEHTRRQLAEWDTIGKAIEKTGAEFETFDRKPAAAAAS